MGCRPFGQQPAPLGLRYHHDQFAFHAKCFPVPGR